MSEELVEKSREFAKKIINLAVDEGLTVIELKGAIDIAEAIAEESVIELDAIKRSDFFLTTNAHCYTKQEGFRNAEGSYQ